MTIQVCISFEVAFLPDAKQNVSSPQELKSWTSEKGIRNHLQGKQQGKLLTFCACSTLWEYFRSNCARYSMGSMGRRSQISASASCRTLPRGAARYSLFSGSHTSNPPVSRFSANIFQKSSKLHILMTKEDYCMPKSCEACSAFLFNGTLGISVVL